MVAVQVPAEQTVGPVHPIPPHCPQSVCVAPDAVVVGVPGLLAGGAGADVVPAAVVEAGGAGAAVADPAGTDGTVEGWFAVFQVAAVGHGVLTMVSGAVP